MIFVFCVFYFFSFFFLVISLSLFQLSKNCKEGAGAGAGTGVTDVRRKSFVQSVSAAADYVSDPASSLSRKTATSIKETTTTRASGANGGKKAVSLALSVDAYKKILDRKKANRKSVRGGGDAGSVIGSDLATTLAPIASTLKINKEPVTATLTSPSSLTATPVAPRRSLIIRDRSDVCSALHLSERSGAWI